MFFVCMIFVACSSRKKQNSDELSAMSASKDDGSDLLDDLNQDMSAEAPSSKSAKSKNHSAKVARVSKVASRSIASVTAKGAFATTTKNCTAFVGEDESEKARNIAAGKTIWTEKTESGHFRIYLKDSSAAYLKPSCFE